MDNSFGILIPFFGVSIVLMIVFLVVGSKMRKKGEDKKQEDLQSKAILIYYSDNLIIDGVKVKMTDGKLDKQGERYIPVEPGKRVIKGRFSEYVQGMVSNKTYKTDLMEFELDLERGKTYRLSMQNDLVEDGVVFYAPLTFDNGKEKYIVCEVVA